MNMRKFFLTCAVAVFACGSVVFADNDATVISMAATVASAAEWADATPEIAVGDWTGGTITAVGEDLTVTKALTLWTNVDVTLSQAGSTNDGILTNGTETLTTSYQITGDVGTPDSGYKAAAAVETTDFFHASNTYAVTHVSGTGAYTINLLVKAESDDAQAEDAGNYEAGVTITATWT